MTAPASLDPKHRWLASIFGALAAPILTTVLAGGGLSSYWLAVCFGDDGRCDDLDRIFKWSALHAVLLGTHAILTGGIVGFVAITLRRRFATLGSAALLGATLGAGVGALAGFELWSARGGKPPLVVGILAHAFVGGLVASFVGSRSRAAEARGATLREPRLQGGLGERRPPS